MTTYEAMLYFKARIENAPHLNLKPVTLLAEAKALEALKLMHILAKEIAEQEEEKSGKNADRK